MRNSNNDISQCLQITVLLKRSLVILNYFLVHFSFKDLDNHSADVRKNSVETFILKIKQKFLMKKNSKF